MASAAILQAAFAGAQAVWIDNGMPEHADAPWSFRWSYIENSSETVLGQPYKPYQHNLALQRRLADNAFLGFGHDYRALNLPVVGGVPADTNGHVHRLGAGWRHDGQERRYEAVIGVATSSNALKHPGDLGSDDLRFAGAIEQRLGASWKVALRADDRSGHFRIYPGFEWFHQPAPAHQLRVGFPEASWRWRLAPQVQSEVAVFPDGGSWHVRDVDLQRQSDVRQSVWRAAWSLRWQPARAFFVEGRIGWNFNTWLRYQLRDGTETRVDPPDTSFFGLAAGARF